MKFVKNISKKLIASILLLSLIFSVGINCLRESKSNSKNNIEISESSERHRRRSKNKYRTQSEAIRAQSEANPPVSNTTNLTLGTNFNTMINATMANVDLRAFKSMNQNSKFHKMFNKQIEEIFYIFKSNKMAGVTDFRNAYFLFIKHFSNCDKDHDQLLNLQEFIACMKSDPFLNLIQAPNKLYTTNSEYLKKPESFATSLFLFADNYDLKALNFYDYVVLRLAAFAWRKCSVNDPFIDETSG